MASFVSRLHKHGQSKVQVTILASEWGSSNGGLSTINRELAIQLAKFSRLEVTFFLPKCSDEDKKAAERHGISIVVATRRAGYDELDWLSFPPGHLKIDVVVGHGVKLGRQAQVICESHNCKWFQVVHTDPEELGMFKDYENPISTGEEKHHVEKELCQMADFVVGVGPKLAEAFRKYLGSCKKHQDVFEFTPGIFDEFSSVQQIPDERKQCSVLVFGRGDEEDFKLKGFDIAAKAVAALSDTILVFVGSPHGKQEEIAKQFTDFGIPANRLRVRSYMEREALKELFCEVDLVLMPSRTEGFGLTGLEALSAGLPVLVSKNSGFGEALDSIQVGSIFVMDSEDHSTWTGAIKDIWHKDRKSRLDKVKTVRDFYAERYSWSEQCKHLVEKMIKLVDETSSNPEITAQAKKAREQNGNKDFAGVQGDGSKFAAHKRICKKIFRNIRRHERNVRICDLQCGPRKQGAQGGHEKKRFFGDHQEIFICSSSGSTSESFLREGPDQPEEVSAGGAQGMRPRSNAVSRKPPIHAVREENPDQPSVSAGGVQGTRPRTNAVSRDCRKPPIHVAGEENPDQPSGAQGGHEKKRFFGDHQEIFICSSSGSTSESFLREGPDQPEEASGPQRKRSRSNPLSNSLRKPSSHAVKEENPDQPSAGGVQGMRPRTNAVSSDCRKPPIHVAGEENQDQPSGAQGGHEKKRSLSDHQETFIRSSSGSTSDEFLPREGPDQPEEGWEMRPRSNAVPRKCRKPPIHVAGEENPDQPSVSAGGVQGMRPRTNAVSSDCRKPPIHVAGEENQDQPSGAQGGHEKKRSLSDHQETFIRSSSGSTSDEFLPREGPDQPEEATGPQRKWSRGYSLPNSLRKQPIPAVKEGYIGQDNSSFKVPDFGLCKWKVNLNYSIYSGRARHYTC
ncbi:uncharacterized protein LOC114976089 isoform X4 [Acropora millepora]|uniref:uncharacterized protein LOC114976089 isoform X4 n=1 Tax=Acropora millepora TaxID=45264 RepID=UPI001CF1FF17|nr:uncharacterized protein LOC114976089 isoform X4 [Acropora millepora]